MRKARLWRAFLFSAGLTLGVAGRDAGAGDQAILQPLGPGHRHPDPL